MTKNCGAEYPHAVYDDGCAIICTDTLAHLGNHSDESDHDGDGSVITWKRD